MKFDDLYLIPAGFCHIESRKDVNPTVTIAGTRLETAIIASNMDTVYSPLLARETAKAGAISCVHRFCTIEENVSLFQAGWYFGGFAPIKPWVSIGTNMTEWERAKALIRAGAEVVLIDVANAACQAAVDQFKRLKQNYQVKVVVGNFTTSEQIHTFVHKAGYIPDAIKISVGSGSQCLTEKFTVGAGLPPVQTVLECRKAGLPMIFDGGFSSPRDFNIAIALGCEAVMMGRQFAGTYESGGNKVVKNKFDTIYDSYNPSIHTNPTHSYYRGSAAADSYADQGKTAKWRPIEGKSSYVEITGTVADMLQNYGAALRSAMTYCDSNTVDEFHAKVKWGIKSKL
jgi:IMP dehydrogenase